MTRLLVDDVDNVNEVLFLRLCVIVGGCKLTNGINCCCGYILLFEFEDEDDDDDEEEDDDEDDKELAFD